jgi:hypothetical protein
MEIGLLLNYFYSADIHQNPIKIQRNSRYLSSRTTLERPISHNNSMGQIGVACSKDTGDFPGIRP